jgi:simple sugar transport system permease protein
MVTALIWGVPIILAALGEMLVERSGRVNLGVDGMMAFSAAVSVAVASITGSPIPGLIAGGLAGLALSTIYTITVVGLKLDQIVVGLIIALTGLGLADLVASTGHKIGPYIPYGSMLHNILVAMTVILPIALWIILYRTPYGVELRAIGYDESIARERGLRVDLIRAITISTGGLMAGAAGAYMAFVLYNGRYFSGITGGWGWLAIGSVILGYWHPVGVALAAYAVSLLIVTRPLIASELGLPPTIVPITPYIAVVIALIIVSIVSRRKPSLIPPKPL